MIQLPAKFAETLAPNPFERALLRCVTIHTGEVELPDPALGQGLSALIGFLRGRARDVNVDRSVVGNVTQIDRKRGVLVALHQPVVASCRLRMARDELFDAEHLAK